MSTIRLGVVGHGHRISSVIKHCLRQAYPSHLQPEVRVVGIVDPDEAGARARLAESDRDQVRFYGGLDEMVRAANLDGLLIGTRCNLHAPMAIAAAQYDLPLYLEKPVAISYEQAIALEKAYESARCPVVVSFPLRVSPLCVKARALIQGGATGKPLHVSAVNYVPYGTVYWEAGYRDYEVTGGLFLQKATHDFDYLMMLMDAPIMRIAAMASFQQVFGGSKPSGLRCSDCDEQQSCLESPQNRVVNGAGGSHADHLCLYSVDCGDAASGTNEDCSSAVFEFANGGHGVYSQVFYARRDAGARGAIVSGYQGTVNFDWYRNDIVCVHHHEPFTERVTAGAGLSHFGGDAALAIDYLDVITGRGESRTPITTGLQSVYTCLAARESYQQSRIVEVRQVGAVA